MHPFPRLRRALALGALLPLSCGRPAPTVVYVGDGLARALDPSSFLGAIQDVLDGLPPPRVRIVPWSASSRRSGAIEASEADQAAIYVAAESIVAVVGHSGSKSTLLAAPIYQEAHLPLLVPTATARDLRALGDGIFMLAPPDDEVGGALVDFALDTLGAQRLAAMYVADPYGNGVRAGIGERLSARGLALAGEAALTGTECARAPTAMRSVVRALVRRARPDAIVIVLAQDASVCAIRLLAAEAPDVPLLLSDSFVLDDGMRALTTAELRTVHSLSFWTARDDSLTRAVTAKMIARIGRPPDAGNALTIDGYLLVAAAARDGATTRGAVAAWLRRLGTPGGPTFTGLTGPIDFQAPRRAILHVQRAVPGDATRARRGAAR